MEQVSVVIASDSFKGSASSQEVASLLEQGVRRVVPNCRVSSFAIADGGEGTVDAVVSAKNGEIRTVTVSGPLGEEVEAHYGMIDHKTAVLEMAEASGITLIEQNSENARKASSLGVGQVILDAIDQGAEKIYVGLGGSATSDGGAGMAKALGVRFLDSEGEPIPCGLEGLQSLASIDCSRLTTKLSGVELIALTDVSNPLTGTDGAVSVYGPQKGIPVDDVDCLDGWMRNYANLLNATVGYEVDKVPGSGAAGGLGAAMVAFCGAKIQRGIEAVLDLIELEPALEGADLVITGEGRMDSQSAFGKAPVGVAKMAKRAGAAVVAVVGSRAEDLGEVYECGIDMVLPIPIGPLSLVQCMGRTETLLPIAGETAMRAYLLGR